MCGEISKGLTSGLHKDEQTTITRHSFFRHTGPLSQNEPLFPQTNVFVRSLQYRATYSVSKAMYSYLIMEMDTLFCIEAALPQLLVRNLPVSLLEARA